MLHKKKMLVYGAPRTGTSNRRHMLSAESSIQMYGEVFNKHVRPEVYQVLLSIFKYDPT